MSETFQPSLYQTEPDGEAADSGKPSPPNGRFSGRVAAGNALAALLGYFNGKKAVNGTPRLMPRASTPAEANGEISDADAVNLLRTHRMPGSDIFPFVDSTASLWTRCRRMIAARLRRSRPSS